MAETRWLEVRVTVGPEAAEAVVELFNRHGRGQAVVEAAVDCFEHELADFLPETLVVKTYLPLDPGSAPARRRLEEGLWHLGQIMPIPAPTVRELGDEDWVEAWKAQYHRLRVGSDLVIVPAWEAYDPAPGEVVIRLEPGMAFGTGLHPTTRLCLAAIEAEVAPGRPVLDVGTGSGVLAIAAAKRGAGPVVAIDADPIAVAVAAENVAANGVARAVDVRHASLPGGDVLPRHFAADEKPPLVESGVFDLVLVNILAPVIVGMAPALAGRCATGGRLVAAGLIEEQEADVRATLGAHGFRLVDRSQEQDWVCLVLVRHPA